jgi:predicted flap endonuclease-1-like 5' DNA nuclease
MLCKPSLETRQGDFLMSMFSIPEEFMPSAGKSPFAAFEMPKWFGAYEMNVPGFDLSAFRMEVPAMPEPAVAAMLPATAMALAPAAAVGYWTGLFEAMNAGMFDGARAVSNTESSPVPVEPAAMAAAFAPVAEALEAPETGAVEDAPVEEPRKQASWKSALGKVKLARTTIESRPTGLEAPRGGVADDLQLIAGVGPKIETILHDLGIYHYDQIAAWTEREVEWVDDYLKFSGRIIRENWIAQAAALARGGRDEYVKVFGKEPR